MLDFMSGKNNFAGLHEHLKEVIEGVAFRGSQRSTRFLQYIVEQATSGHFESLKERAIGIDLFGRSPTYDPGDDAIVRVTANDVRKRLLHHYSVYGTASQFRISLPPGSYVPEIAHPPQQNGAAAPVQKTPSHVDPTSTPAPPGVIPASIVRRPGHPDLVKWLLVAACILGLNVATWIVSGKWHTPRRSPQISLLPWSAFFQGQHATFLVTSDPNIAEIQGLMRSTVTVSDYANQNYVTDPNSLSPDALRFSNHVLKGDKAANVDIPIVASVAELAQERSAKIGIRASRDLQLADLETDNNFIFLGSPRSNPWVSLFDDQLDFRFYFDKNSWQEVIRNVHQHPGEPAEYVPTAKGGATGESFATISFVRNPDHAGQILLLAGANAEGTKAAGELITDLPRLSAALQHCGIRSSGPLQHFQLLLRLSTMAHSPRTFDVLTCHILP
jgi:hypothetical protein